MPLTNVTLATPLLTGLGVTAEGDVVQPDIDNRVVLNDVMVRVNDVDISDLCTHVSFQSSTDERDVTTYGSRNRVRRLGGIYRIEVQLDLILGTDEATSLVPTSELLPTSQQLLTGAAGDVWTGIQFDQLFDSDLPTRVEIAPRRFPVPPIDGNPLFEVPCRITKWTRLSGGVGEPASASLTLVGTAALGVSRGVRAIVTPPPASTTKIIVVSTAVETSTAQGLARRIRVVQAVESELSSTVARRGVADFALETSLAMQITPRKTRGVTQVTETNSPQAITVRKTRALIQVTDTEIGTQFSVRGTLGRAIAVETAQPIARRKARAIVAAVDAEQSMPVARGALGGTLYPSNTLYPSDTLYPAFFLAPQAVLIDPADDEFETAQPMVIARSGAKRPRAGFPYPITPQPAGPGPVTTFDPLFAVAGGSGRNAQPAFQYAPLPTNVSIDTTINQAAFQTELNSRAQTSRWINYSDFTTKRVFVPNAQPIEPVLLYRSNWGGGFTGTNYPSWALSMDKVCRAGFPVPPDYVPDAGTDKELVLLQPDYQIPQWAALTPPLIGRMFEGWVFERNPAYDPTQPKVWPNYVWRCGWPGRVAGLNISPGHFMDWQTNSPQSFWPFQGYDGTNPQNPDSTWQSAGEGASASGIALADSEILIEDLNRNINGGQWGLGHCIGLSVPTVGGYRWPAQRSDASSPSTYPIYYGMRVCLPANFVIPSNLHPVCRALVQNCIISDDPARRGYGFVVHEQTNSSVVFKAQPGAQVYWQGVSPDVVLNGFPWNQLQVIETGHDTIPVRLSTATPTGSPTNTTPPVVAGPVAQGQTIGLYKGIWSGTLPITYTFKWQRSPTGTTWTDIAGAISQAYVAQAADVGQLLRGAVTATNSVGVSTEFSAPSTVVASGPAPFMRDSFAGTNGVTVESRAGELAATWIKHTASTGSGSDTIQVNRAMGPTGSGTNIYYSSATPLSADYDVTVLINELANNDSSHVEAAGRMDINTNTHYFLGYGSTSNTCSLNVIVNGVNTVLDSVVLVPKVAMTLRMIGDQITGIIDDQVVLGPVTNATITAIGRAGFRHGGLNSTTAGVHIDNIESAANTAGGTSGPVLFMQDTFTGVNGTTIVSRAGEVGATWTKNTASTASTDDTIQANRAMGPIGSGTNIYHSSAVPPSADYDVTVRMTQLTDNDSSHVEAAGRMSTTANTHYFMAYGSTSNNCSLNVIVNGVNTVLASVLLVPTASLTLRMIGNQITGFVDGVQVLGPITDSAISTAGRAGFRHGGFHSATTGVHVDSIEASTNTTVPLSPTTAQSSLSIASTSGTGNITVTFNKPYQVGQFANGDNFVLPDPTLGTVVVTAMTPTYTTGRHGYAVNPKATAFNVSNSFDNRGPEDSAFVAPPALPLTLTPNQSLIKVASMVTQTSFSWIDNAAVVTVLASAPPVGTMRPAAFGTDKRLISSTAISGSLFPNLSATVVPSRLTYAECIARCQPFRNDYHPGPSWGYYRSSASAVPGGLTWGGDVLKSDIELLCSLCLNHLTATEKKDIAIRYAQHGIDTWGVSVPATGGGAGFLRGGGANGAGHLLSLSFAAWLTNDTAIQGFLDNASEATWNPVGGAGIGAAAFLYWETASFYRSSVTSQALWGKKWETNIGDGEAGYWSDLNVPAGVGGVNNATLRDPYERIDGGPVPGGSYQDTVSHQIMGLAALMDVMTGFEAAWPSLVQNDAVLRDYGHRWQLNGIRTAPDPVAPKTALGSYGVNYGPSPMSGTGGPGYDGTGVNGYIGGSGRAPSLNNTGAGGGNRFSQLTDDFATTYSTASSPNNFAARPASSFEDSIGINIHASATVASGSAYGNGLDIANAMNYVGFKHFRDGYQAPALVSDAPGNVALKQEDVATRTGATICLMLDETGLVGQVDDQAHVNQSVGWIQQYMPHVGILEGENEADNGAIGGSGPTRAQQRQQWLRAAWPGTLLGPSYINNTNYATNQAAFMDGSNAHPYPPAAQALDTISRVDGQLTIVKQQAPGKPVYSTETGYSKNACIGRTAITEIEQARWTISEILLNIRQGAVRIYLYELFNNDGCDWGFFEHTVAKNPKPQATLLRDWMTLLRDPGTSPTSARLGYSFTGTQDFVSLLWAKSDGSFWLTFWPTIERGTSDRTFTMTPVRDAQFIQLYKPNLGTAVQQQFSNVVGGSTVTIGPIGDDPFLVKVTP